MNEEKTYYITEGDLAKIEKRINDLEDRIKTLENLIKKEG